MRCAACGTPNRSDVTFCYNCGEPLDEESTPAIAATPENAPDEAPSARRALRWEVLLGAALVLVVAAIAAVTGWQDAGRAEQHRVYDQAQTALAAGDKAKALDTFARAGDYADAPAQYARLLPEVSTLKDEYGAAARSAADGAWWDAARMLTAASNIQLSYQDVVTRLQQARTQSGPLFFRRPGPDGTVGLWWAQADGADAVRLQDSGADSALLSLAPDDRWAVYSGATLSDTLTAGPYLLDLSNGQVRSLAQEYRTLESVPWVRFRADSRGFWWGAGTQAYYYDLETRVGLPLSELPGAFDLAHGRVLLNRLLLPSLDTVHSVLFLADPLGRQRIPLADERAEFAAASFSDDGEYLLYNEYSLPGVDATGRAVVTTTLVLTDLDTADGPRRTVLYTRQDSQDAFAVTMLRPTFVPGTHTVLALIADSSGWSLRAWPAPSQPVLLLTSADVPGQTLTGVTAVPGGQQIAAGLAATKDGRTDLLLLRLAGGRATPAPHVLAGRWLTFAPDGRMALIAHADFETPRVASLGRLLDLGPSTGGLPVVRADYEMPVTLPSLAPGQAPTFTRDGRRVLLLGDLGQGQGLYAMHPDSTGAVLIASTTTAFWTGRDPAPALLDR
jgi:hypothetical protein